MTSRTVTPIILLMAIVACGAADKDPHALNRAGNTVDSTAPSGDPNSNPGTESTPNGTGGRGARQYGIKSARIIMKSTSAVGEPMTLTIEFDDFGALESTRQDMVATVQGKRLEITNVTIIRDGWAVIFDPKSRIGTRSPATSGFLANIPNFTALDSSARIAMNYRALDPKTIAGYSCQGHEFIKDGLPIRVWLWEGIPLRSEIEIQPESSIVSEATVVEVGVPHADSTFVVPNDVKVATVGKNNEG